jgi:hypothetical protein
VANFLDIAGDPLHDEHRFAEGASLVQGLAYVVLLIA